MTINIPKQILKSSGITPNEFLLEIAVSLYHRQILSLGKAASFAKMHRFEFQKALAQRQIPIHFSAEELEKDLITLTKLGL